MCALDRPAHSVLPPALLVARWPTAQEIATPLKDGWGITSDGTHLIVGDSSEMLYWLDPNTLEVARKVAVTGGQGGWLLSCVWTALRLEPNAVEVAGKVVVRGGQGTLLWAHRKPGLFEACSACSLSIQSAARPPALHHSSLNSCSASAAVDQLTHRRWRPAGQVAERAGVCGGPHLGQRVADRLHRAGRGGWLLNIGRAGWIYVLRA